MPDPSRNVRKKGRRAAAQHICFRCPRLKLRPGAEPDDELRSALSRCCYGQPPGSVQAAGAAR